MGNLKNVNLEVSSFAIQCVKNVKDKNAKDKNNMIKDYKTLVKKMSTLIQKNGFIGTLVFNLSKIDKSHHKEVLENIIQWNLKNYKINSINHIDCIDNYIDKDKIEKYIKWVTTLESQEYRLVTKEMMNLFVWVKRFADGMIEDELVKGEL